MAALRYRDEHNKVGYLQKPKGSDDYHQILDFLGASHIRYALTIDPSIFDSLVKQIWSTATLRSPKLGPLAILATIDATPYTITEDSLNFVGQPMPLLAAMLSQAGEGAGVFAPAIPQVIPEPTLEPMPETDQPPDHLIVPPRQ
ncbi:hypothetical protein Tco_1036958 [Tanacetum coccineum]